MRAREISRGSTQPLLNGFFRDKSFHRMRYISTKWEFVLVTHMKLNTGGCYKKVCLETRREIESEVGNDRVKNLGEVKGVIGVGRHVQ